MGKIILFVFFARLHAAQIVFHVGIYQHADQKPAHATIDLRPRHIINPRPTRCVSGKVSVHTRRPQRNQQGSWSRRQEVGHGVLRSSPKPEKNFFLYMGEGSTSERDRDWLWAVFYTQAAKCLFFRRVAGVRHISPAVVLRLWPGSEPLTSASRWGFMTQSFF